MLKPVSRDTLTRQVKETIKRFIVQENLGNGARLPSERELSDSLSVSRNIVREALSGLVSEGIIVKEVGRGNFVGDVDPDQITASLPVTLGENGASPQALREARVALEIGSVGLIVQRITDEEIENLKALLASYEQKHHEGKSTVKEDIDFHLGLLNATKNQVIQDMAPLVMEVFRQTLVEGPSAMRRNPDRIIAEHRRILIALENRDIAELREAMQVHFRLQNFPV
ncbi:MAG: hypothetical protein CL610_08035 [Anaerolineaceae bacterium]|nr:hypothetical protein [Anaerolineaceae bacterium]